MQDVRVQCELIKGRDLWEVMVRLDTDGNWHTLQVCLVKVDVGCQYVQNSQNGC